MKKHFPFIFLILFSLCFILFYYHPIIFNPNCYLFGNIGDGIKNYFTYCFHIRYDSPVFNFEGMNYPYGENIFYTDCHPALTLLFKFLSSPAGFISSHSIGILNFILIFSIFLTFPVCYFLLREFKIEKWISVLFSIGITLLAPQIFRLSGHLALSYSMAIPLSWLLMMKFWNTTRLTWLIALFVNNLCWLFIHAYLGMIVILFLALMVIFKFASDPEKRKAISGYLRVLSATLLPVVIFMITLKSSDIHTGRTENPSGFFIYNAEFDDVFLPNHPPLKPVFDSLTGGKIKQEWEAWSYVGFPAVMLILASLVIAIRSLVKREKSVFIKQLFSSGNLNPAIISSLVLLLFAMAIPFKQIPALTDLLPVVKQFRATGRFTWPFYFVVMIFSAVMLQQLYMNSKLIGKIIPAFFLVVLSGFINILEGLPYHAEVSDSLTRSKNLFDRSQLPESFQKAIASVKPGEFQAILPLPFYYYGSESFSRPRNDKTVSASIVVSYHTGLPLAAANLTRTSIWESKNIAQLATPGYYPKKLVNDLPDERPFLVIRTKDAITEYESAMFAHCKPIFESDEISVYELKKADLFRDTSSDIISNYESEKGKLFPNEGFNVNRENAFLYFNDFETSKSEKTFRGQGAFAGIKKDKNTLAEFPPNTFANDKKYVLRLWMNNASPDALNDWFRLIVEEYDQPNEKWISTTFFPEQCETINGDWSLAEFTFKVENPSNPVAIVTIGKKYEKAPLIVDDLLITEEGVDVYRLDEKDHSLFYNNHAIKIEKQ